MNKLLHDIEVTSTKLLIAFGAFCVAGSMAFAASAPDLSFAPHEGNTPQPAPSLEYVCGDGESVVNYFAPRRGCGAEGGAQGFQVICHDRSVHVYDDLSSCEPRDVLARQAQELCQSRCAPTMVQSLPTPLGSCRDTDNGDFPYLAGTVSVEAEDMTVYADTCLDEKTLSEAYCDGHTAHTKQISCPGSCIDGACASDNLILLSSCGTPKDGWLPGYTYTFSKDLVLGDNAQDRHCFSFQDTHDIILDCGDHMISSRRSGDLAGVNIAGSHNISIRNCGITDFQTGLTIDTSEGIRLDHLDLMANQFGIEVASSKHIGLHDLTISQSIAGHALRVFNTSHLRMYDSFVTGNADGVFVTGPSSDMDFQRNVIADQESFGMALSQEGGNLSHVYVIGNTIVDNALYGLRLSGSDIHASQNIICHNAGTDLALEPEYGLSIVNAEENTFGSATNLRHWPAAYTECAE